MATEHIRLTAEGMLLSVSTQKVEKLISKKKALHYLGEKIYLEDKCTFLSFIKMFIHYKSLQNLDAHIKDLLEAAKVKRHIVDETYKVKEVVIYKSVGVTCCEGSNWLDMYAAPSVIHEGDDTHWAIEYTPIGNLIPAKLKIERDNEVYITNEPLKFSYREKMDTEVTFFEFIRGLMFELAWEGSPMKKK